MARLGQICLAFNPCSSPLRVPRSSPSIIYFTLYCSDSTCLLLWAGKSDKPLAQTQGLDKPLNVISHAWQVNANPCRILDVGKAMLHCRPLEHTGADSPGECALNWGCGSILHSPPNAGKRAQSWSQFPTSVIFWKPSRFSYFDWWLTASPQAFCTIVLPWNLLTSSSRFDQILWGVGEEGEEEKSGFQGLRLFGK